MFCTGTQNHLTETDFPSGLISNKIQHGGGCHFEIHINGYNSAAIAHIRTIFDTEAENEILDVVCQQIVRDKIQDGGNSESVVSKGMSDIKSGHHIVIFRR